MRRILQLFVSRRVSGIYKPQRSVLKLKTARPSLANSVKLLIGTSICSALTVDESTKKMTTEEDIHKALEEGDIAIIQLMDQLKEFVQIISEEYRKTLNKQIEITEAASTTGPLSEMWDELPKHRTFADELLKEINEYVALFNTIGQLAKEKSLVKFVMTNKDNLDMVTIKYKELEEIMQYELEQNKRLEIKLLRTHCDSILNELSIEMEDAKNKSSNPQSTTPS